MFSTCIDADKRAFGHVIEAADAPALVLGLKELQAHLEAVLHQAVRAHLRITAALLVTLVDPEGDEAKKHEDQVDGSFLLFVAH